MENELYAALPLAMNGVPRDPTQFIAPCPRRQQRQHAGGRSLHGAFNGGQTYHNEVYLEGHAR